MIKTILFDLDGTLLPMDLPVFIGDYFSRLTRRIVPLGYEPEGVMKGLRAGVKAMILNDGTCTNEERFWQAFSAVLGEDILEQKEDFDLFYQTEFNEIAKVCGYNANARKLIDMLHEMGLRTVLATSPLFPAVATESRIRWAGLTPEDFELYTTYENHTYCKPNPKYYEEVLAKIDCKPEECLMIGNDTRDDLIAETLGIKVFLLTDCLINEKGIDITDYPHGGFPELFTFIRSYVS